MFPYRKALLVLAPCLFALVSSARAAIGPENVAVVVNGDSWASLTVANEYARLRHIPPANFILLSGLSSIETTDVDHFRREILEPVFDALDKRGISNQIDCITYSVDVPYAVDVNADMAGKKFPLVITGMASTNGLTYLHDWVAKKDTDYLRLDINRYNRRSLPLPIGSALSSADNQVLAEGLSLHDQKQYVKAANLLGGRLTEQRNDPDVADDLACCWALAGEPQKAMDALQMAVASGWRNAYQLTGDPDLASLNGREDLKKLIERIKAMPVKVQPGLSFRSGYRWTTAGEPGQVGPHYMLSTMLGVTCGRGNSVNEVLDSLRRSAAADGTAPRGSIYFPKNGDVRSTTRAWAFETAAAELRALGINAVVEDGVLPQNRSDVAGAMIGISDFDWSLSKSTVLPGAIIEHLTSFGGIITERAGQSPCTDFIRAGASGSSGTVTEPYALQQKFPTAFMHVQYCKGFTLAESFYQSLFGPYQLLVIGDPLCKPWAKSIKVTVPGLLDNMTVKGSLPLKPKVTQVDAPSVAEFRLYVDGHLSSKGTPGSLLTFNSNAVPDGVHLLSFVAIQKDATQSRSSVSFTLRVNNMRRVLTASVQGGTDVAFGAPVSIRVSSPGATSIGIMHLGRRVGSIPGSSGLIQIPSTSLGLGTVILQPFARFSRSTTEGPVLSTPLELKIIPQSLNSSAPMVGEKSANGLVLVVEGDASFVVKDTIEGGWLSSLIHGTSQHFTLSGDFDVPKADLYQIQLKTNTGAAIKVD